MKDSDILCFIQFIYTLPKVYRQVQNLNMSKTKTEYKRDCFGLPVVHVLLYMSIINLK